MHSYTLLNMETKTELLKIDKETIDCYRGTGYGCVIYLKNNTEVRTKLSFIEVDNIFNCL